MMEILIAFLFLVTTLFGYILIISSEIRMKILFCIKRNRIITLEDKRPISKLILDEFGDL
jgi:hypothetical protein